MKNFPSVAVVILNWNGKHWLEKFLPSVASSSYPNLQLIVGDNASTDGSIAFLRSNYPSFRIIENSTNLGFAGGYNAVLKEVEADYYVLLNSDVEVTGNWISPVVQLMETDSAIAAAQPKLIWQADKKTFEYAGAAGGFIDILGYPFCRGRVFESVETDERQYDDVAEIFWASGACLFVRSKVYHEMGGFDADYFAHMEEIDLCWRMKNAGYKIFYCPHATVYHVGGGMLPKSNPFKTKLNFRNSLVTLFKNLPRRKLWLVVIIRLLLDWVAIGRFMVRSNWGEARAVFSSHLYFFKTLPVNLKKRRKIEQKHSIVSGKSAGYYRGSIVWQHFVAGKKRFRDFVW